MVPLANPDGSWLLFTRSDSYNYGIESCHLLVCHLVLVPWHQWPFASIFCCSLTDQLSFAWPRRWCFQMNWERSCFVLNVWFSRWVWSWWKPETVYLCLCCCCWCFRCSSVNSFWSAAIHWAESSMLDPVDFDRVHLAAPIAEGDPARCLAHPYPRAGLELHLHRMDQAGSPPHSRGWSRCSARSPLLSHYSLAACACWACLFDSESVDLASFSSGWSSLLAWRSSCWSI